MFIKEAWAQAGAPPGGDVWSMLPIILMFVVLYFLMIRPQMKRAKEHKAMIDALQKGDEVVAAAALECLGRTDQIAAAQKGIGEIGTTDFVYAREGIVFD